MRACKRGLTPSLGLRGSTRGHPGVSHFVGFISSPTFNDDLHPRALLDDHFFDTFSSRTCNGHPLPCNSTGACVSEADAAKVFSIGDFEYK